MNKISKLGMIFDKIADELNITPTMLEKAEKSYNALGDYLKEYNNEWELYMYPQGSFELGTVKHDAPGRLLQPSHRLR